MVEDLSQEFIQYLKERSKFLVCVVELYSRDTVDISSLAAPKKAIARFSNVCFVWQNTTGSYEYQAKIPEGGISSPSKYLDGKVNSASVTISNTKRGKDSAAKFVLNNKIKGCYMVIRLIAPELPNESLVFWWGKCSRPGKIDNTTVQLEATQEIGNFNAEIPTVTYGALCPNVFGKDDCKGNKSIEEHSATWQQALATYGTAGCADHKYETCVKLGNTEFNRSQRNVAKGGQFSYIDTSAKNTTTKTKRKDLPVVKTENWSSMNQTDSGSEVVPLGFGRFQLAGHPTTWADEGTQVKSLQAFCEGKISSFNFIRSRNYGKEISQIIQHLGDWGGQGTQTLDALFNGTSGYNSRLAYLEIVTNSLPTETDDAPLITAVIKGLELPVPDVNGNYLINNWSNNPIHIIRYLFTNYKLGKVPEYRMADVSNLIEADYCDELVEDRTFSEVIILPSNAYDSYNEGYRRYRSAGRYTAYRDAYEHGEVQGVEPEFEQPQVRWFDQGISNIVTPAQNILRQRYTLNGALQEKTKLLDFITERLLPCFKGYIAYDHHGQIQIKAKRPADNTYISANVDQGTLTLPVTNISKWRNNLRGSVLVGVATPNAEIRQAKGIEYSTVCNGTKIEVTSTLDITTSDIVGGSKFNPAIGFIDINQAPVANDVVNITIGEPIEETIISYVADAIESQNGLTRMLMRYLNANYNFKRFYSAYIMEGQPNRIWIRCEVGQIILDEELEFKHNQADEILRVQMVFENCNDLYSTKSAKYDNIVVDSFSWNDDTEDDINAVTAKYTSAVDDFNVVELLPRAAWDVIDQEGEINKKELDLRFVDNYYQAAFLAKSTAIESIDGNVPFKWKSGMAATLLEMGDVVALRHDSGDGVINYVPVVIKACHTDLDSFQVELEASLYLSSAFDERVSPIDATLTSILSPDLLSVTPPTLGTSGSYTTSPEPSYPDSTSDYYSEFGQQKYSPRGEDLI